MEILLFDRQMINCEKLKKTNCNIKNVFIDATYQIPVSENEDEYYEYDEDKEKNSNFINVSQTIIMNHTFKLNRTNLGLIKNDKEIV